MTQILNIDLNRKKGKQFLELDKLSLYLYHGIGLR
jgi:hypothetical protein